LVAVPVPVLNDPPSVAPIYVTDAAGERSLLRSIVSHGEFSFDLETTGLDPHAAGSAIGLTIIECGGQAYFLRSVPSWLPSVIADPDTIKRGFNLKFDLKWLAKFHPEILTLGARNIQDCYVNNLLVKTKRGSGGNNLQNTVAERLGIRIEKDVDHEQVDWTGALTPDMEKYATEDVLLLPALDAELKRLTKSTRQARPWRIESNAVLSVAAMELNGIPVDTGLWNHNINQWWVHFWLTLDKLRAGCSDVKNWNSSNQIKAALGMLYGMTPDDTKHSTLMLLQNEMPILNDLIEYRHWAKRVSSWGDSQPKNGNYKVPFLEKYVHDITGRFHPSWWQLSTMTGRFSCTAPNAQQFPRDPDFREMFRAPDGWAFVSLDYEQIEMLVAAYYAPDPTLLSLFHQGIDTHSQVVAWIKDITLAEFLAQPKDVVKKQRQIGKSANFGLLFGMGAPTLRVYSKVNYDVDMTEDEARRIIKVYFDKFRGLSAMRNRTFTRFNDPRLEEAWIRNLIDASRHLTRADGSLKATTAMNTPIQGTAGYGIKAALRYIMDAELLPYLIGQVHDEMLFLFPRDGLSDYVSTAKEAMVKGMRQVLDWQAPVRVDEHIGPSWSEEEEW
jgi:DNA polymerase I-like protein with 3'-5' exonuclease and polymerase domains